MKKYKAIDILWALSLLVIAIISVIWAIVSAVEISLPKALIVTFGVIDLVAVFLLVFTSVRKVIENKSKNSR